MAKRAGASGGVVRQRYETCITTCVEIAEVMAYPGSWKYLFLSALAFLRSTFRTDIESPLEPWIRGVGVASEEAKSDAIANTAAHVGNRILDVGTPLSVLWVHCLKDVEPGECHGRVSTPQGLYWFETQRYSYKM